ncbi:mCE-family protein [Mycobacterium intracellulare]|nr:mCE-family protein [Mycobacterium intracellulare]
MKISGTITRLSIFSVVLLIFTVMIFVVFGQMRFDRTNGYSAEFSNISGLRRASSSAPRASRSARSTRWSWSTAASAPG